MILSQTQLQRKRQLFEANTCFDSVVTDQLNERLPDSVPYLNYKDLEPKKVVTEQEKQERKV